uniref:DNA topoisomerase 2 n=1 Tax=Albugo laibachii Nc14 TaxID=890382 RepID=F0WWU7_9STRA|nr:DNA topoisomerase putative [Albugo laibachii Nc14]|eukprot:CCA25924.1 DNA topoisomerase putative [Albugo laibachii Nc14]
MYIGSMEEVTENVWVVNENTVGNIVEMYLESIEYVPALYKIFDEIIVNALDNKKRDCKMKALDVVIDTTNEKQPWIMIYNDGRGIPVQIHPTEQIYIPELVFGNLLTGSNFDDHSTRFTGGRHGYGAKLTNIFSNTFIVETGDTVTGMKYKQIWRNNMRELEEPHIEPLSAGVKDYTRISFSPDLKLFQLESLSTDILRLLKKRVYDVAGCVDDVKVSLNGSVIPISGFESYIRGFEFHQKLSTTKGNSNCVTSRVNKHWHIGVLPSEVGFTQVSFVNGISTLRGGTHVLHVVEQITRRVADHIVKKYSEINATPAQVKPYLAVYINCMIENPTFDSQMKECLTSRPSSFGTLCNLPERFFKAVIRDTGIVEHTVQGIRSKQRSALMKKVSTARSKSIFNVPKLEDANLAGGSQSHECSLILTEGDSAKALAVAGLAVVGRDRFGVFPLRGKLLNVRDATVNQLSKNSEFMNLCTILGLQMGESYDTIKKRQQLRYGHVIVMTDQDYDGSHIKGLLFNIFHTFWPNLLRSSEFIQVFVTPIIKATSKRDSKHEKVLSFYSLPEYLDWRKSLAANEGKNYYIKYYKGLGTSTSAEAREYFSNLNKHLIQMKWQSEEDGQLLEMVFSKSRACDRKNWLLQNYDSSSFLCRKQGVFSYKDFVNQELIQFSHADNTRSIPSAIDGLKTSQRKVLFACLKRKLFQEMKVAQLAGYCSEHTAYHHGEASLHSTIVNMAQDYVGSNNITLLYPSGQFGTRLQGGKDAASPRYIFTKLNKHTRLIYPEEDDALLNYNDDDGISVEPQYYVPIIPMLLINGSEGIGTGWSTYIPNHNPIEVIDRMLHLLDSSNSRDHGVPPASLLPWFRGFRGSIEAAGLQTYTTQGTIRHLNPTTLEILELPIGKWIDDYKKTLWDFLQKKLIRSFTEHHSEEHVCFRIQLSRADSTFFLDMSPIELVRFFKLESKLNTNNMHAFDPNYTLQRFSSSDDVIKAFLPVRLDLYNRRKEYLVKKQQCDVLELQNRVRFIAQVSAGDLQCILTRKMTKHQVAAVLDSQGYTPEQEFRYDEKSTNDNPASDFDYLLNMSMWSFTLDKANRLEKEHLERLTELRKLQKTTPEEMWRRELLTLRGKLVENGGYQPNDSKMSSLTR